MNGGHEKEREEVRAQGKGEAGKEKGKEGWGRYMEGRGMQERLWGVGMGKAWT